MVVKINHTKEYIMMKDNKKNLMLRVNPELHQKIKLHVVMNNTTIQDYLLGLIEKDMAKNEENKNKGD